MASADYTKWKGKPISKAKPSRRSQELAEEARVIAEAHRQLKRDFLDREKRRREPEHMCEDCGKVPTPADLPYCGDCLGYHFKPLPMT